MNNIITIDSITINIGDVNLKIEGIKLDLNVPPEQLSEYFNSLAKAMGM